MEKTIIPASIWHGKIFRNGKASAEEKLLYLYLASSERGNFLGFYYIPAEHIAYDLAIDVNEAKVLLNRLIEAKLIKYDIENNYVFVPWTIDQIVFRPSLFSRAKSILGSSPAKALVGEIKKLLAGKAKKEANEISLFLKEIPEGQGKFVQEKIPLAAPEKKKKTKKAKETAPDDPLFEAFWAAYPRKEGKEETRRLFAAMKCPDEEKQKFVTAASNYAASCKASGTEREYISTPKNFIKNGKCYDYLGETAKPSYESDLDIEGVICDA